MCHKIIFKPVNKTINKTISKTISKTIYKTLNKTFYKSSNKKSSQHGSSLVLAIFVIVVMSLLGASLMKMMSSSSETFAYEVMGTRAYAAAQTGLQMQLKELFPLNSAAPRCSVALISPPPALPEIQGLIGCNVFDLTCSDFKHDGVTYYTITSTGQCNINGEQTSRTLEVQARSL